MVDNLYDVFTHVDVLKSREPEYFVCQEPIIVDFDSLIGNKNSKSSKETEKVEKLEVIDIDSEQTMEMQTNGALSTTSGASVAPVKTFVTILEEGCKKYYDGSPPVFTPGFMEMMIEKDSFSDFGLGKTKDEALANLENLTIDFQNRESSDDSVTENWVGKVNERCQKLKLLSAVYEIIEEGPPNQRLFIATCKIGKVHVVAHGKTKKIAKTLAAHKMYAQLENWEDLADDAALAAATVAASQETTTHSESLANESLSNPDASADAAVQLDSLQKVRAAFQGGFGATGLTEKLTELINLGEENINKIFPTQKLNFVFLEPDLDVDGPNDMKNAFYGFGATEADAKDYAARNALIHLELFVRTTEPSRGSSDFSETQLPTGSLTQTKNSPKVESQNSSEKH